MNSLWTSGVVAIVWVCLLGSVLGTATGGTAIVPAAPTAAADHR